MGEAQSNQLPGTVDGSASGTRAIPNQDFCWRVANFGAAQMRDAFDAVGATFKEWDEPAGTRVLNAVTDALAFREQYYGGWERYHPFTTEDEYAMAYAACFSLGWKQEAHSLKEKEPSR
jgi:hypothetical protein